MLLEANRSQLLVIDLQTRLLPHLLDAEALEANVLRLVAAARALEVPVLVSEQYPAGLGPSTPDLATALRPGEMFEKTRFSAADEPALTGGKEHGQWVLCGAEAHVCVLQTALAMKARGWDVAVVADAISSRAAFSKAIALRRLAASGVEVVTTEMVLFEWLADARHPAFKTVSGLVK